MAFQLGLFGHTHALDHCDTNHDLFKKILIAIRFGDLKINGQPPEDRPLGDYLDKENFIFDTSALSDDARHRFLKWLYVDHLPSSREAILSRVKLKERRGLSLEVHLSWWGRFKSWLLSRKAQYWSLNQPSMSFDHQIIGVEMSAGDYGLLLSFHQFLAPNSLDRYQDPKTSPKSPLGNCKRIVLRDHMVNGMLCQKLDRLDCSKILHSPHPLSDLIYDRERRYRDMKAYREAHLLKAPESWYQSLWQWCKSWFIKPDKKVYSTPPKNPNAVLKKDNLTVYQHPKDSRLLAVEKAPERDTMIFCGGGSKIYAHIGVWQAFEQHDIKPVHFYGTSAGAIMALACYLGYSSSDIYQFFKDFKQENLVYYQPDLHGLSDNNGLKNAIYWLLIHKLTQLQKKYKFNIPEPVTFRFLHDLKQRYPDCGFGESLTVTITNKTRNKAEFASYIDTPDAAVCDKVTTSANMPGLYRDIIENGEHKTDGGMSSNTPTRALRQKIRSVHHMLQPEADPGVVIVQFDNGPERETLVSTVKKIPRENFLVNLLYRMITGVNDPVRDWLRDRADLRRHAANVILIDVGNISCFRFPVSEDKQLFLIKQGRDAAEEFIAVHYPVVESGVKKCEYMYQHFSSWYELLSHCASQGQRKWFNIIRDHIAESQLPNQKQLLQRALLLERMYFNSNNQCDSKKDPERVDVEPKTVTQVPVFQHRLFLELFDVLKNVPDVLFTNKQHLDLFRRARHQMRTNQFRGVIDTLNQLQGSVHVFIQTLRTVLERLIEQPEPTIFEKLCRIRYFLQHPHACLGDSFYTETKPQHHELEQLMVRLEQHITDPRNATLTTEEEEHEHSHHRSLERHRTLPRL